MATSAPSVVWVTPELYPPLGPSLAALEWIPEARVPPCDGERSTGQRRPSVCLEARIYLGGGELSLWSARTSFPCLPARLSPTVCWMIHLRRV